MFKLLIIDGKDARFCLLEQFFPGGPEHPFASTMMKHFNKLRAPLYPVREYPSLSAQENRFKRCGWHQARARNLWDLWSDDEFLDASSRRSLDAVEPFDEWEEFALFASHYFLLVASTTRKSALDLDDDIISPARTDYQYVPKCFVLESSPPLVGLSGQRRHGSVIADSECSLGHHGGLGRHSRLASSDLYTSSEELSSPIHTLPPRDIPARMCHTITAFNDNHECLLVGGRTSPSSALRDCWLREGGQWHPVHELPIARFRHTAVEVVANGIRTVLVHGGKSSNGSLLDSWLIWDRVRGWQEPDVVSLSRPSPRFGACVETISDTSGIVFGGIGQDGTICQDFWRWRLCQRGNGQMLMKMDDLTEALRSTAPDLFRYIHRLGATINHTSWGLIVAGGIIPRHLLPFDKEIMVLDKTALLCFSESSAAAQLGSNVLSAVDLGLKGGQQRPLLTGHVAYTPGPRQLLFLGGGAICFSFGTFLTGGTFLLKEAESTVTNTWSMVPERKSNTQAPPFVPDYKATNESFSSISRVRVESSAQFEQIVSSGKPVVIEGCDIGPCTSRWTKEYLAETVGPDRKVGILCENILCFY